MFLGRFLFKAASRISLITSVLLFTCLAGPVQAEDYQIPGTNNTLIYTINEDPLTITITGIRSRSSGDLIIPESIDGIPVTSIADYAFDFISGFSRVTISNNVTSIGDSAFYKHGSLTEVIIGTGLSSIGEKAFSGCSNLTSFKVDSENPNYAAVDGILFNKALTELVDYPTGLTGEYSIPGSVTSIANNAFWGNSALTDITIHDNVTSIGAEAFSFCAMDTVIIPASVTYIGPGAFIGCPSLTNIVVDLENSNYASSFGVLYNKSYTELVDYPAASVGDFTIPNTVVTIADSAFSWSRNLTAVTIPDSVTTIGNSAFRLCNSLSTVTLGNSVSTIGDRAFERSSSITSIVIPNSTTYIGHSAFRLCSSLTSALMGSNVTTIGDFAFASCRRLTSIKLPNSVTSIGDYAFDRCTDITSFEIGSGVTTIGNFAFNFCTSMTEILVHPFNSNYSSLNGVLYNKTRTTLITYPDGLLGEFIILNSVTRIEDYAFHGSNVSRVTFPDSLTYIGDFAFYNCDLLSSIVIPDNVTYIGESAFQRCTRISAVSLGNSVTTIGANAFYQCEDLIRISFPDSLTSIGDQAFYASDALSSVSISASVNSIGYLAFGYCFSLTHITVDPENQNFASLDDVLYNKALTQLIAYPSGRSGSFTIPDGVTEIGDAAFYNCFGLTSITIPNSVTTIGDSAFYRCSGISSINISENVTSIGPNAFNGCNLTGNITIPDSVTTLGNGVFQNCYDITSVTIGSGLTAISDSAFYNCSSLSSITFGSNVSSIGNSAFRGCISVTSITIPPSVTSIGGYAFAGCDLLSNITIPNSVTTIGYVAFAGCAITSISIPESVSVIGQRAFNSCSALTEILVDSQNPNFASLNGVLYNKGLSKLITFPEGKAGAFTIPDGVVEIGDSAFSSCTGLSSVAMPDSLTSIGYSAFSNCTGLEAVTLGNSVTTIAGYSFYSCRALINVTIPESVTRINHNAFDRSTNLSSAIFEGNADVILGSSAFDNTATDFTIYYFEDATGFTTPTWEGYPSQMLYYPIANAGPDQNILVTDGSGYENVTLDGSSSYDPDGSITSWSWTWEDGGQQFASGQTTIAELPHGTTIVTLTVVDNHGSLASDTVDVTIKLDSDDDGFSDDLEALLGTSPYNSNERVRAWLSIDESGLPHLHYSPHSESCEFTVEWSDNLSDPNSWQVMAGLNFSGDTSEQSATINNTPPEAFYRIRVTGSQ